MSNWRKAIEQYKKGNKEKVYNFEIFEFYNTTDIMKILNIENKKTIYDLIKSGKLKPCKKGKGFNGKYYFDKEYIDNFKKNQIKKRRLLCVF